MTGRYACQMRLFGKGGQSKLGNAKVAMVGVGGLGTVAAAYLVRAGIGRIELIDRDVVEEGNLNRQLLFEEADVNRPKAVAAAEKLGRMNPSVEVRPRVEEFPCKMAYAPDVILDCSDNLETRLSVNYFAVKNGIPLVYGAASGWVGAISTIIPGVTACLNCLDPGLTEKMGADGCEQSGVSGPLLGVIGSMQASEAVKCIIGDTKSLVTGRILYFDSRKNVFDEAKMKIMPNCPACGGMRRKKK